MMRRFQHSVADMWEGVRTRPGRALAAWCAILASVVLLTLLVAVLGGLENRARRMVSELGANTFAVCAGERGADVRSAALLRNHAAILAASLPECRMAVCRRYVCHVNDDRVPVFGVDAALADIRGWEVVAGRFLDARDARRRCRHAVVGRSLAERYGWWVGSDITLADGTFGIVGILADAPLNAGAPEGLPGPGAVFVPWETAAITFPLSPVAKDAVDAVFVQSSPGQSLEAAVAAARRVADGPEFRESALAWVTPDRLVRDIRGLQKTIAMAAGSVVALCLALAGTTLVSLMLLTVRERVAEIGLRRAIGARPADIAVMFLLEGTVIAGTAAGVAAAVSAVLLRIAAARSLLALRLDLAVFCLPVLGALVLGALCSWPPALSAARLHPADALRTE